jgi:hypothetical protein
MNQVCQVLGAAFLLLGSAELNQEEAQSPMAGIELLEPIHNWLKPFMASRRLTISTWTDEKLGDRGFA